ncbi:hypothetical protein GOBAR_AA17780 [Gossypium barbadense]|uniref:Uncharacterized protein n=1 Tax=Gossypium barbadense TaxID=3634 RepID=A0A2P5XHQ7_GOSBA|nr:hypothetical protein GOBAR_AA17780 [Gossypium barbadense]
MNSDDLDEKAKPPVVQQRGRFKVTSENVQLEKLMDPHPLVSAAAPSDAASSSTPVATPSASSSNQLFPLLQSVLQTNILQRDHILNLMKQVSAGDSIANRPFEGASMPANVSTVTEKSLVLRKLYSGVPMFPFGIGLLLEVAHDREKELLHEISELQWRLICAQEELQKYKTDNAQV